MAAQKLQGRPQRTRRCRFPVFPMTVNKCIHKPFRWDPYPAPYCQHTASLSLVKRQQAVKHCPCLCGSSLGRACNPQVSSNHAKLQLIRDVHQLLQVIFHKRVIDRDTSLLRLQRTQQDEGSVPSTHLAKKKPASR